MSLALHGLRLVMLLPPWPVFCRGGACRWAALSIRVNAEQRDQRNNAEAERKVHTLAPASCVDGCGHHGPEETGSRHGQPEDRLVAVEGNEATQHRRPLGYEAPQSA